MNSGALAVALCGGLAGVACALSAPTAARLASRLGVIDEPMGRKGHDSPTPLLGGAALFVGLLVGGLVVAWFPLDRTIWRLMPAVAVMFALGLMDDFRPLHAAAKLVGQLVPTAWLIIQLSPVAITGVAPLDIALTVLAVLTVTNAVNLLDNMNGLAAGTVAIAATGLGALAARNIPGAWLLAAIIVGICVGYLPFNFPKARIFMGDAGALLLGFLVSALALMVVNGEPRLALPSVAVLALPLADTALVVVSRTRRGLNPFTTPGLDHISHRLARLTGSRVKAVALCWVAAAVAAVLGVVTTSA